MSSTNIDPDNIEVGRELAVKVAKRLKMKCDLMFDHRDYCGIGLTWQERQFQYGRVFDGYKMKPLLTFDSQHDLVDWLAAQTNKSLSGIDEIDLSYRNNQRITIERLLAFVSGPAKTRIE
jgi:hypothetical protein